MPNALVTTTQYDLNYGLVSAVLNRLSGADLSTLSSPTYSYTPGGRISSKVSPGDTQTYGYDMAGRLSSVTDAGIAASYAYDGNTNRCASSTSCDGSYVYDAADRLLTSPFAGSYAYDAHGNLVSASPTSGAASAETITYDGNDHARTIDDGTNTTTDMLSTSGRVLREVVTVDSTSATVSDTTYSFGDGSFSPVASWPTATPTAAATTTYVNDSEGNLVVTDTGGAPKYDIANAHGDIIGTFSKTGVFKAFPTTDVWGLGEKSTTPLDYLGAKEKFATGGLLGLVRMGERLYAPALGRFLGVDPIEGGSANNYDYVNQDPINGSDLTGQCAGWGCVGYALAAIEEGADGVGAMALGGFTVGVGCATVVGCVVSVPAGGGLIAGGVTMEVLAGLDVHELFKHPQRQRPAQRGRARGRSKGRPLGRHRVR